MQARREDRDAGCATSLETECGELVSGYTNAYNISRDIVHTRNLANFLGLITSQESSDSPSSAA